MTPLRFSQNLFFSIRKFSVLFKSSPTESTRFFCTILLFSKLVAWGESPGWRSRQFAVSTDRTSVSVFNLSWDLKRYKRTFCTKFIRNFTDIKLDQNKSWHSSQNVNSILNFYFSCFPCSSFPTIAKGFPILLNIKVIRISLIANIPWMWIFFCDPSVGNDPPSLKR